MVSEDHEQEGKGGQEGEGTCRRASRSAAVRVYAQPRRQEAVADRRGSRRDGQTDLRALYAGQRTVRHSGHAVGGEGTDAVRLQEVKEGGRGVRIEEPVQLGLVDGNGYSRQYRVYRRNGGIQVHASELPLQKADTDHEGYAGVYRGRARSDHQQGNVGKGADDPSGQAPEAEKGTAKHLFGAGRMRRLRCEDVLRRERRQQILPLLQVQKHQPGKDLHTALYPRGRSLQAGSQATSGVSFLPQTVRASFCP